MIVVQKVAAVFLKSSKSLAVRLSSCTVKLLLRVLWERVCFCRLDRLHPRVRKSGASTGQSFREAASRLGSVGPSIPFDTGWSRCCGENPFIKILRAGTVASHGKQILKRLRLPAFHWGDGGRGASQCTPHLATAVAACTVLHQTQKF